MTLRLKAGNKFGAKGVVIDGIRFDSQAEGRRYSELKLLEKAGEIDSLTVHPKFLLLAACGRPGAVCMDNHSVGAYEADFQYRNSTAARWIVEDVKGLDTPLSKWKRKHVKAQYGIPVQIVRMK